MTRSAGGQMAAYRHFGSRRTDRTGMSSRVVELRHFAGLSIEDAAATLGLSRATAYRHWTYARAWLRDAVSGAESD